MRRESSTVVVLAGAVSDRLLAELGSSPNVSVVGLLPDEGERPGWQAGALAMREAARRKSTYVLLADDPLARVAAQWQAMWDPAAGSAAPGATGFEEQAAEALAAWRDKRYELPDYYLVIAAGPGTGEDPGPDGAGHHGAGFYLGPLRAARPRRVAVAAASASLPAQVAGVRDTLRGLAQGPWWPPLGELISGARGFYAGGLAESQQPGPGLARPGSSHS